jgi:hypothetical protein
MKILKETHKTKERLNEEFNKRKEGKRGEDTIQELSKHFASKSTQERSISYSSE